VIPGVDEGDLFNERPVEDLDLDPWSLSRTPRRCRERANSVGLNVTSTLG